MTYKLSIDQIHELYSSLRYSYSLYAMFGYKLKDLRAYTTKLHEWWRAIEGWDAKTIDGIIREGR